MQNMARQQAQAALHAQGLTAQIEPLGARIGSKTQLFCAGDLVVKVWAEGQEDRAARQVERQRAVAPQMTGAFAVPDVVFFDPDRRVMAMALVAGQTLKARWNNGEPEVARHAGGWLAAYHDLSAREAPFWPKGQLNWLAGLVEAGTSGKRDIVEFAAFCDAVEQVRKGRAKVRGLPCRKVITHRDMTLSNLMFDGQTVWGFDLENAREDEALRDVFTLALDLAVMGKEASDQALGDLRRAYGDAITPPELRLFLQRCFCLWVWANTPNAPSNRQLERFSWAERWLRLDVPVI